MQSEKSPAKSGQGSTRSVKRSPTSNKLSPPPDKSVPLAQFECIARLFEVLADHGRLHVLYLLKRGPANVSEIMQRTGLKQSNASKQLGILFDAGFLERERQGNQVRYRIREPLIFELCDLVCRKVERDAKSQAALFAH